MSAGMPYGKALSLNDRHHFFSVAQQQSLRPVSRIDQRIDEAAKMGFERIFISKYNKGNFEKLKIDVIVVSKIDEVFRQLFA